VKTFNPLHTLSAKLWTAVTCHRFVRLADLSAKQRRVQRRGELPQPVVHSESVRPATFAGDKSPAESGENSPHSKALGARRVGFARSLRETLREFGDTLAARLAPRPNWRRYRVTPRANPAAFRHDLLRGIQLELRSAGLVNSREVAGRTTL
jgi:hypothetical protein